MKVLESTMANFPKHAQVYTVPERTLAMWLVPTGLNLYRTQTRSA